MFSSMKLVTRRILTAGLSAMWNATCVKKAWIRTCMLTVPMTSIECLEMRRRYTSRAACRWTVQCWGKRNFRGTIGKAPASNKHSIGYNVRLCITIDADKKWADFLIIVIIFSSIFWLSEFLGFACFCLGLNFASNGNNTSSSGHLALI